MPYIKPDDGVSSLTSPSPEDIDKLAESSPKSLRVWDYKLDTLHPLAPLRGLKALWFINLSHLSSLSGLETLASLTSLILSTPPTWDGRGKYVEVESYAPIGQLKELETLVITGVRPADGSLDPLGSLSSLKSLELAHVPDFTVEQLARLAARLPHVEGRALKPYSIIEGVGICKRCRGQQALLNGARKRSKKWVCPECDRATLAAHVAEWNRYQATAR